jgi:hypothetical protein
VVRVLSAEEVTPEAGLVMTKKIAASTLAAAAPPTPLEVGMIEVSLTVMLQPSAITKELTREIASELGLPARLSRAGQVIGIMAGVIGISGAVTAAAPAAKIAGAKADLARHASLITEDPNRNGRRMQAGQSRVTIAADHLARVASAAIAASFKRGYRTLRGGHRPVAWPSGTAVSSPCRERGPSGSGGRALKLEDWELLRLGRNRVMENILDAALALLLQRHPTSTEQHTKGIISG